MKVRGAWAVVNMASMTGSVIPHEETVAYAGGISCLVMMRLTELESIHLHEVKRHLPM
jgi:hypothetical protein